MSASTPPLVPKSLSPNQRAWARFKRNRLGVVSLYLFTLLGLVVKLVSDVIYTLVDPRVQFGAVGR